MKTRSGGAKAASRTPVAPVCTNMSDCNTDPRAPPKKIPGKYRVFSLGVIGARTHVSFKRPGARRNIAITAGKLLIQKVSRSICL